MSDTEFAKEVAEQVWGWGSPDDQLVGNTVSLKGKWTDPYTGEHWWSVIEEVNSWQGFGRTVEAMGKMECKFSRGFTFSADGIEVEFSRCVGQKGEEDNFGPIYQSGSHLYTDSVSMIEATHQAALDAVKEEKK